MADLQDPLPARQTDTAYRGRSLAAMILSLLAVTSLGWVFQEPKDSPGQAGYVGSATCATCHFEQGNDQEGSNFEGSWRPASALPEEGFAKSVREGEIQYRIEKSAEGWLYTVQLPGLPAESFPVHSIIGGNRFGTSFILEVSRLGKVDLPRPVLVEARYMIEAGNGRLKLSPGFPRDLPLSYETAVGRVLSREFASNCMDCHGGIVDPQRARQGGPHPQYLDTGVSCERCHGPGRAHLAWLDGEMEGNPQIVHPGKLTSPEAMKLCGNCHSGFFPVVQPRPQDLLISNQVTALSNSECYVQSGGGLSCVSCHDGHGNAPHDDPRYVQTCLGCHDAGRQIRICPVNSAGGCIDCHMPTNSTQDNFALTDHWIRVIDR